MVEVFTFLGLVLILLTHSSNHSTLILIFLPFLYLGSLIQTYCNLNRCLPDIVFSVCSRVGAYFYKAQICVCVCVCLHAEIRETMLKLNS